MWFSWVSVLHRADTGVHVSTFVRIRCKLVDPATDRPAGGAVERKHVVFLGKCSINFIFCFSKVGRKYM